MFYLPLSFQFYFPPQFFLFPFSTILLFSLLNVFIPSSTIFYYFPSSMFFIPLHHNFNIFPQFHYFPSSMLLFPPLQFYYFPSSSSPSSSSSLLLFSLLHLLILIVLIGSMWGDVMNKMPWYLINLRGKLIKYIQFDGFINDVLFYFYLVANTFHARLIS